MNEFKVGDIVECIDNYSEEEELTTGKKYEVKYIELDFICIINNKGKLEWFYLSGFKLVEKDEYKNE